MRSVVVVLPASTWAMMPILRISERGVVRAIAEFRNYQVGSGARILTRRYRACRKKFHPWDLGTGLPRRTLRQTSSLAKLSRCNPRDSGAGPCSPVAPPRLSPGNSITSLPNELFEAATGPLRLGRPKRQRTPTAAVELATGHPRPKRF